MSSRARAVREDEDKEKSSGLGVAAAAAVVGVGLGIGAALYYFFKPDPQEAQHASAHRTDRGQHLAEKDDMNQINQEIYRDRAWTLEQCSICFEEMLRSEHSGRQLWKLPCGHQFHLSCVRPWTLEHSTCPNCRKAI